MKSVGAIDVAQVLLTTQIRILKFFLLLRSNDKSIKNRAELRRYINHLCV